MRSSAASFIFILLCILILAVPKGAQAGSVVFGGLFDLSGPNSDLGEAALAGARAAVRELNDSGGIRGRDVEFLVVDTAGNDERMLAGARTLNEVQKALVLLGPETPALNDKARRYAESYKKLLFLVSGMEPMLPIQRKPIRYAFSTSVDLSTEIKALFRFLRSSGLTELGAAVQSSHAGRRVGLWLKGFAPEYGLKVGCLGYFDPDVEDLALRFSQLDRCSSKVNVIWADWDGGGRLWQALPGMVKPAALFHTTIEPPTDEYGRPRLVPVTVYGVVPAVYLRDKLPSWHPCAFQMGRFLDYMADDALEMDFRRLLIAAQAWDAVHLAAAGMRKAEGLWTDAVRKALEEEVPEYRGVTGIYRPTKNNHSGLLPRSLLILEWQGRAWRPAR